MSIKVEFNEDFSSTTDNIKLLELNDFVYNAICKGEKGKKNSKCEERESNDVYFKR